jgi:alpha/beta superfamily hydrolase
MPRRIESLLLDGPAGKLEALLEEPDDQPAREAALICHPHPQHGGTMHNKVVYRIARGMRRAGAVALRFNYRGVNRSEGGYDGGIGEIEDARAALAYLRTQSAVLPSSEPGPWVPASPPISPTPEFRRCCWTSRPKPRAMASMPR